MGRKSDRKRRFLEAHPICCFCGGEKRATTIDHAPPRTCFPGRAFPEGFEFPSCDECQTITRLDEQALAYYVIFTLPDYDGFTEKHVVDVMTGVRNNMPHLLYNKPTAPNDVRRLLRKVGLRKPLNVATSDIPIVELPEELHSHIFRYARELACALFYREFGRIAPRGYNICSAWELTTNSSASKFKPLLKMMPILVNGARSNLDMGPFFLYRFNTFERSDGIVALVKLGVVLFFVGVMDDASMRTFPPGSVFLRVSELYQLGEEAQIRI